MDVKVTTQIDASNPIIGDLYLDHGTIRTTNTLSESVVQDLMIALRFFKGEWFLDPDQGLPYFQSILGQKTPIAIVSQIFRRVISGRPGIKSIDSFAVRRVDARSLRLDFACTLANGVALLSSDYAPFLLGF